ncbi:aquaporin [Dokdonella sp.]|uniref:aquaporin n=1 Tax=Dokdonella sp. TaxID=2291710 RepID=UPI00378403CA
MSTLPSRLLAEFVATALLLCAVIGSGIMGASLAGGNGAIALLANTGATVAALFVLIEVFGPVSGAHMNPLVSLVMGLRGGLPRRSVLPYAVAQMAGGVAGTWLAHAMFALPILQASQHVRSGFGLWLGEVVATAGLLLVVLRAPPARVSALVAAYIGAAYWFTSSTSFANPAATFGRMWSDTFAGIAPSSAAGFIVAEACGAALGMVLHQLLGGGSASSPGNAPARG